MFLDPEPRRPPTTGSTSSRSSSSIRSNSSSSRNHLSRAAGTDMSSAFFASTRRPPLQERSRSHINRQSFATKTTSDDAAKPTVRLVTQSPSPPHTEQENTHAARGGRRRRDEECVEQTGWLSNDAESTWVDEASEALRRVSDSLPSTNEALPVEPPPAVSVTPVRSPLEPPKPWLHRRSLSSGEHSQSSTVYGSEIAVSKKSYRSERLSDFSQVSTVREFTPPVQQDSRESSAEADVPHRFAPTQILETLPETSPERPARRSTIRAVPASDTSSVADSRSCDAFRPRTPSSQSRQDRRLQHKSSRRTLSTGSIQSWPSILDAHHASSSAFTDQARPKSQAISEATLSIFSSPNVITSSPDSTRPVSQTDAQLGAASVGSSLGFTEYVWAARPATGRSIAERSSAASLHSSNPLPPIHVPKRRLRHKPASDSLNLQARVPGAADMADIDIDILPYPKDFYNRDLSTIASETDPPSHDPSQDLSNFSLGSGNLADSPTKAPDTQWHDNDSGDDPGDMTLGIFREQSAIPQPLFQTADTSAKHALLLPIPPIPGAKEDDEDFDTLSALQGPPLRQKRSGYSIRGRAEAPPSHSRHQSQVSYAESDRASIIFPTWAKHFYTGAVVLSTKPSLTSLASSSGRPTIHRRAQSCCTERSVTSRLGTAHSNLETESQASSHFLPSIFRPQSRKRHDSQHDSRSSQRPRSVTSQQVLDRVSQDSMIISPVPPTDGETLPSGQPRWGALKDHDGPQTGQRRLPSTYDTQRQWDQMNFPRPMTTDRSSDFGLHIPHLAPSRRASQNRLSAWRAPSFVSGLDTLLTSRCNRQILLFALGFPCPLLWILAAFLPLPPRSSSSAAADLEHASELDPYAATVKHEAHEAERPWSEEWAFEKARWWRTLNRVMSLVGLLVIAAVIALAVVAAR